MSYSIGDGTVVLALVAGVVGYVYVQHQTRRKRLEIVHQERLVAMEKGIPLPEFPLEPAPEPFIKPNPDVLPILGTVLFTLSLGTMVVLYRTLEAAEHEFWVSPMPFTFLGVGLIAFHFLKGEPRR
jgi:hypothetical protein